MPQCPKCLRMYPSNSVMCPRCKIHFQQQLQPVGIQCNCCSQVNPPNSNFCNNCNATLSGTYPNNQLVQQQQHNQQFQQTQLQMQAQQLQMQQQAIAMQAQQMQSMARCPRCGCTSLSGNKKGFGIGKAVIGAAIAGPIGLVAGNIHAKKVRVTCIRCGKTFMA